MDPLDAPDPVMLHTEPSLDAWFEPPEPVQAPRARGGLWTGILLGTALGFALGIGTSTIVAPVEREPVEADPVAVALPAPLPPPVEAAPAAIEPPAPRRVRRAAPPPPPPAQLRPSPPAATVRARPPEATVQPRTPAG